MEQQSESSKYYHANKDKFEDYSRCVTRINCDICGKSYKFNYYEEHLKCSMHKRRERKANR